LVLTQNERRNQAMGLESFDLPCAAAGDVAELEYISALHQTGATLRVDGSVHGTACCDDPIIRNHLISCLFPSVVVVSRSG
jgi:hypothetical protein